MRILVTNDDGIHADGIAALVRAIMGHDPAHPEALADQILVVAPQTVQSATSHGITFSSPLMVRETVCADTVRGFAVDGRPADCVKLALTTLWPAAFGPDSRPDLVLSGINAGANSGINVVYSGTVAAAIEAAFLGLPSLAFSLHLVDRHPDWDTAGRLARRTLDRLIAPGLPRPHECLSVNLPPLSVPIGNESTVETVVCPMNLHGMNDRYERRHAPDGRSYYWPTAACLDFRATDRGSDVDHLLAGRITVTPLHYDLTRRDSMDWWTEVLENREQNPRP